MAACVAFLVYYECLVQESLDSYYGSGNVLCTLPVPKGSFADPSVEPNFIGMVFGSCNVMLIRKSAAVLDFTHFLS